MIKSLRKDRHYRVLVVFDRQKDLHDEIWAPFDGAHHLVVNNLGSTVLKLYGTGSL